MTAPWHLGVVHFRNPPLQLERLRASLAVAQAAPGAPPLEVHWHDNAPDNIGFGRAHNRLMRRAFDSPDVRAYLCLNPDTVAHPRLLTELARALHRHPEAGLLEARQQPNEHPKPYDAVTHETPWCSGCALVITREAWEATGGFDERFFLYCEDVDLSWRVRAAGLRTRVVPAAWVFHDVDARIHNAVAEREMLWAGAQLGRKYGAERFAREQVEKYQGLGGEPRELEPLGTPTAQADFSNGYFFASPRWVP